MSTYTYDLYNSRLKQIGIKKNRSCINVDILCNIIFYFKIKI